MLKRFRKKNDYIVVKNYDKKPDIPEGMWIKCPECSKIIYAEDLETSNMICPSCNYIFSLSARKRLENILDEGSFSEMNGDIVTNNPLNFEGYDVKLKKAEENSGENESVITGTGRINGKEVCIGVMEPKFMMGSLGSATGERITRLTEYATENKLPLILFCASGGARMQEGIISLMQMAKVSAAIAKHDEAGLLYISVLTNPTTGGVTASFAMQGDVIIAEPKATVGFAGRRVIENTIKEKLPDDFQSSEKSLENGFVDMIVQRNDMKEKLSDILSVLAF